VLTARGPCRLQSLAATVSGELLELAGDDLRFRAWEVERLFRDFYGDELRPDELARLARRRRAGRPAFSSSISPRVASHANERLRILAGLGSSSRFVRDYLARNVVAELPDELRDFLVRTSVLRRLNGSLCDALLERSGSRELLEELERRSVFRSRLMTKARFGTTKSCEATSRRCWSRLPVRRAHGPGAPGRRAPRGLRGSGRGPGRVQPGRGLAAVDRLLELSRAATRRRFTGPGSTPSRQRSSCRTPG